MRLLFDQNLSRTLVRLLADLYPDSTHVTELGMERAADLAICELALRQGLTIVTKDTDFVDHARENGWPPKVIHFATGNCTTQAIADLLRLQVVVIAEFERSKAAVLVLRLP